MIDLGITLIVGEPPQVTEKDFSIVIAHRGETLGLWATVHSCEAELAGSGYKYEYIIVFNGEDKVSDELYTMVQGMKKESLYGDFIHHVSPLSPPSARQLATESANGKYLFFFDDHCIPSRGYFKRALEQMTSKGLVCLHSTTNYLLGDKRHHYKLTLADNFWSQEHSTNQNPGTDPYRIAMAGHGGWVIRKDVFNQVGGYGPLGMFQGWGGEESYFDLKLAQFGFTNWLDPQLIHYHYPAKNRGYGRHCTPAFYRNMLLSSYLIGGGEWLSKVFDSFSKQAGVDVAALHDEAVQIGHSHAAWLERNRKYTLNEVLEQFRHDNVAH